MKCRPLLLFIIVVTVVCLHGASARGGRGGGGRFSSSRYSSYRYSSYRYSYSSYRYSSYRSYYSSGGFRTSSYSMAPVILVRRGGYGGNKQLLMMAGTVYIAHSLRPRFYSSGTGWGYSGSYDEVAVCENSFRGLDANNVTVAYQYFVCPSDIQNVFTLDEKYCCGQPKYQVCCDEEAFYRQYGVEVGPSVAVIVGACVGCLLFLCCTCGMIAYCRMRNNRRGQVPVLIADPSKGAHSSGAAIPLVYPLQPPPQQFDGGVGDSGMGPAGYPLLPPAPQFDGGVGYPSQPAPPQFNGSAATGPVSYPLYPPQQQQPPAGAPPTGIGAAPYPDYQQQQQQQYGGGGLPPPNVQPPPYPGPM